MVNRALRTQNTECIVKMGFFIRDLHRQIEQLHVEQLDWYMESFFLYRGQGLSIADFEMMQKSKGGLMSFNSFLSTSMSPKVSDLHADSARQNPDLIGVVFELEIDLWIPSTPFAFIGDRSYFNEENEFLFSMHTIFRICDIEPREDGLWRVKLSLTSDNDQEMKMLTEYIRRNIKDGTGLQRLGALMLEMGEYDKAIEVYEALVRATHSDADRQALSSVYNQLGAIYNLQGKIDKALAHYNTSLEMKLTYLSPNDPSLSPIYSNIGSALRNQNKLNEALEYMERALNIELQASQSDPFKIASYHNNIGLILTDQNKYNNALIHYEKALEIQQKCLPPNHPQLATSFNNIGTIYNELKDYDKALSCYTKSLKIMQRSLLPNHPDLVTSHNNLGAIYSELEDYKKALDYYERSLDVIQQSLSSDHPSLALAYHNLSLTWYRLHSYERALTYGEKAVDIYRRAFEPNHPQLMACQETLDTICKEL
jgi:tetratricopeptide (TPR) repeat protein